MGRFSDRLYELRKERGLGPVEIDRALGLSAGTVERFEVGTLVPDSDILERMAAFFIVESEYLSGAKDERVPMVPHVTGTVTTRPGLAGTVVRGIWGTRPGKASEDKEKGQD